MNNKYKIILVLIVIVSIGIVLYNFRYHENLPGAISPAGTTGSSGKYLSQTISLATASGTTTSLYNGSGFDFAMRAVDITCQGLGSSKTAYSGAGLATLNFKAATSSTNLVTGIVSDINTNYLANTNISTSTVDSYNATTTEGVIAGTSRIWPNGTYLIVSANATNTAACAIGVSVMPL